jgi:hypothetical protein
MSGKKWWALSFMDIKKEVAHRTTSSPNQIKPNYKFILNNECRD